MPRAVVFFAYGGPEVLQVIEVDEPQAGPNQVRVRVRAAGVNPAECKLRRGYFEGRIPVTFPQRIGNEFAGIVDQVGEGVTDLQVGDEVLGNTLMQSYADYVVANAPEVAPKPGDMPWEVAGSLPVVGQTAYTALREIGVGVGDTVLVHAAAGGVGTIAVQLARLWGARVIGTASEPNHDYLRSLGAIPVTYGDGLAERVRALAPEGVTASLDAIGGASIPPTIELGVKPERIGTVIDMEAVAKYGIKRVGTRSRPALLEIADLYAQGKLQLPTSQTFSLEQAADAHRAVDAGHVRGKAVLRIS